MSPEVATLASAIAILGVILGLAQTRLVKPFLAPLLLALFTKIALATDSAEVPTIDDVLNLTGLILGVAIAIAFSFNAFSVLGLFPNTSVWVQVFGTGLIIGGGGDAVALLLKLGGTATQAVSLKLQAASVNARSRLDTLKVQAAHQSQTIRPSAAG